MVSVSNLILNSKFKFTGLGRLFFWHNSEMKARHLPIQYAVICPVAAGIMEASGCTNCPSFSHIHCQEKESFPRKKPSEKPC